MAKGIIIGAGPSVFEKNHLELLAKSNYNGTLLITDKMLKPCLDAGITPQRFSRYFVFTIEDLEIIANFFIETPHSNKIKVICSERTKKSVMDKILSNNYNISIDSWEYLKLTPGVGLMAFCFAWRELKLDELCLIGMNQGSNKMSVPMPEDSEAFSLFYKKILNPDLNEWTYLNPSAQLWREAFFDFLELMPQNTEVINCTEGGSLFGNGIKNMRFEDWLLMKQ